MKLTTLIVSNLLNKNFVVLGELQDDLGFEDKMLRTEMANALRECRKAKVRVKSFPILYYGERSKAYALAL